MMKRMHYHWTFLFLWGLGICWLIQSPNVASILFSGILLLRFIYLRQCHIWVCMMGCTLLLLGRFWFIQQTRYQIEHSDTTVNDTTYILDVSPLTIRETDTQWIGKGELQLETGVILVEWRLSKEQLANLPKEKQRWQLQGKLLRPEPARNFFVFDYAQYLATQEIYWQLDIQAIREQYRVADVLENARIAFMQPFLSQQSLDWVALHNKLLWNLDSPAYRSYRSELVTLGVAHFFAISGFHVHYIRRLLDHWLRRSGMTIEGSRWLLLFLLIIYSWLVRFPVGVVRVIVTLYGDQLVRRYQLPFSSLDVLALTGIGLLLWQPQFSVGIGFLLSFLMTYLIHFYSQNISTTKSRLRQQIELTVTCLLFSWPIIMQQSHEWNGWQLVYVVLFGLVFERWLFPLFVVTSIGLWCLPTQFFEPVSQLFASIWQGAGQVTSIFQPLVVGHLPWGIFACLIGVASYWLYAIHRHPRRAIWSVIIGYGVTLYVVPYLNPVASITIIDVGQGDALLYRPAFSQEAWLIDTGGRPDLRHKTLTADANYANRTIIPALKALGVRQLTAVVITHPDLDHIGNLEQLAQVIPIETVVITPYTQQSIIWQQIDTVLSSRTQRQIFPFISYMQHPRLPIQLFTGPDLSTQEAMDGANDTSIVARIELGSVSLLNMGDLSSSAEEVLMHYYPNLMADILKTGHHGSKHSTSEAFLAQIQPRLALISAGYQNRYGHPHAETLARLQQAHVPYLATSDLGAIQLTYDALRGLQVRTVLQVEENE